MSHFEEAYEDWRAAQGDDRDEDWRGDGDEDWGYLWHTLQEPIVLPDPPAPVPEAAAVVTSAPLLPSPPSSGETRSLHSPPSSAADQVLPPADLRLPSLPESSQPEPQPERQQQQRSRKRAHSASVGPSDRPSQRRAPVPGPSAPVLPPRAPCQCRCGQCGGYYRQPTAPVPQQQQIPEVPVPQQQQIPEMLVPQQQQFPGGPVPLTPAAVGPLPRESMFGGGPYRLPPPPFYSLGPNYTTFQPAGYAVNPWWDPRLWQL